MRTYGGHERRGDGWFKARKKSRTREYLEAFYARVKPWFDRYMSGVAPRIQRQARGEAGGRTSPKKQPWIELAGVHFPEGPEEAEDGKGYIIEWADGRALVCFRYRKDAQEFAGHEGHDVVQVVYDLPPKGMRICD